MELLKAMQAEHRAPANGQVDFARAHRQAPLFKNPIALMPEMYEHEELDDFVGNVIDLFRD